MGDLANTLKGKLDLQGIGTFGVSLGGIVVGDAGCSLLVSHLLLQL
jgi:hypothetical protein